VNVEAMTRVGSQRHRGERKYRLSIRIQFVPRNKDFARLFGVVPFDDNLQPATPPTYDALCCLSLLTTPTLTYPSILPQSVYKLRLGKLFPNNFLGLGFLNDTLA